MRKQSDYHDLIDEHDYDGETARCVDCGRTTYHNSAWRWPAICPRCVRDRERVWRRPDHLLPRFGGRYGER